MDTMSEGSGARETMGRGLEDLKAEYQTDEDEGIGGLATIASGSGEATERGIEDPKGKYGTGAGKVAGGLATSDGSVKSAAKFAIAAFGFIMRSRTSEWH
jgi:hypothetical protein